MSNKLNDLYHHKESLFSLLYDLYLSKTGKGTYYKVPVGENTTDHIREVVVLAANEDEANRRAISLCKRSQVSDHMSIEDKSMGIRYSNDKYNLNHIRKNSWRPWKWTVYARGADKAFNNSGVFLKSAVSNFLSINSTSNKNIATDIKSIKVYIRNTMFSSLIYFAFILSAIVFMALGLNDEIINRFYLKWLNPYIVASVSCSIVGILGEIKCIRDINILINFTNNSEKE